MTLYQNRGKPNVEEVPPISTAERNLGNAGLKSSESRKSTAPRTSVYKIPSYHDVPILVNQEPAIKLASFEEPSFQSIDVIGQDDKKSIPRVSKKRINRPGTPWYLLLMVSIVILTCFLLIPLFQTKKVPQFVPLALFPIVLFIISIMISTLSILPRNAKAFQQVSHNYPLNLSLFVGATVSACLCGAVSTIPLMSRIFFLASGCFLLATFIESYILSVQYRLFKTLPDTHTQQYAMYEQFIETLKCKKQAMVLDMADPFYTHILFRELKGIQERISKKSLQYYTNDTEKIFGILNRYSNPDITEFELHEAIHGLIYDVNNELEERVSMFSCCERIRFIFYKFLVYVDVILILATVIPFPFALLPLFLGIVASPFVLVDVYRALVISQGLYHRLWHVGSRVSVDDVQYHIKTFNFNSARLWNDDQVVDIQMPLENTAIVQRQQTTYQVYADVSQDQLYLIQKGLKKKTHRFVWDVQIRPTSQNSHLCIFVYKHEKRPCFGAIEEVLSKNGISYDRVNELD